MIEHDLYAGYHNELGRLKGRLSLTDQLLLIDLKTYLHELPMKQDQMSMAASIESRVPFLDHHLIEYITGLPAAFKVSGRTTKILLRMAMERVGLPRTMLDRPKMGFPVPLDTWFRKQHRGMVESLLFDGRLAERNLLRMEYTRKLAGDHFAGSLVIGEDGGALGGAFRATEGLLARFGKRRVIDTPVSEGAVVGGAIGAAPRGLRPVAEMQFMDFVSRGFDLLVNFAAKYRYRTGLGVPMVLRGPCGAGVHGGPFHSQTPEAGFLHVPGLKVVFPATASDAKGLLLSAIRDEDPVVSLEHKYLYRRVRDRIPAGDHAVPIGVAAVRRPGRVLTIVTYGAMLWTALEGAAELSKEGIEAEVLGLRTLLPLDEPAILDSVGRTARGRVLHEDTRTGGVGAEIAALLAEKAFDRLDAPVVR